jgi:ABC-2 type transport system permease protein
MAGTITVFKKELADHFGSKRYLIEFLIILLLSTLSAYQGALYLKENPSRGFLAIFSGQMFGFSFIQLMVYFGPIIGLSLGFDAINKERTSGTLSTVLSQPIFRDSILNGKFLASVIAVITLTVSTIGIMIGIAIPMIGFGPSFEAMLSTLALTALTIIYLSFWISLGMLFSVVTKKTSTSMLASVGTWLTCIIIISILASLVANFLVPMPSVQGIIPGDNPFQGNRTPGGGGFILPNQTSEYRALAEKRYSIQSTISKISPTNLYSESASAILGVTQSRIGFDLTNPNPNSNLTLSQGLIATWADIATIIVGLIVCFASSYILFLRSEIRPGG